jgi:hypothetical protein
MNALVATSPRAPEPASPPAVVRRGLAILGPGLVVGIAWVTEGERTPMALVDIALLLAVVNVSVALVSWRGGLVTSITAGLALDYFHTEPIHSLRITSSTDIVAVVLLGALGISVSAASALRLRALARAHHDHLASDARDMLEASMRSPRVASEMWLDSVRASSHRLSLVECRVVRGSGDTRLPEIVRHRAGIDKGPEQFVLPEGGALMAFADPRRGHVLLTPQEGLGSIDLDRRVVTAFVDQLDLAISSPDRAETV